MVSPPSSATLKKYGLSAEEWLKILESQGGVCPICKKVPSTGRFVVDHDHVPKFKEKPPEERKLYVRGLLCWWCNHTYVGRAITIAKAEAVVEYLKTYVARRPS